MSMTLTPSSGPMVSFAPGARRLDRALHGLVTAARGQDQGHRGYGHMRGPNIDVVPARAGTHNHRRALLRQDASTDFPVAATRSMGPCLAPSLKLRRPMP